MALKKKTNTEPLEPIKRGRKPKVTTEKKAEKVFSTEENNKDDAENFAWMDDVEDAKNTAPEIPAEDPLIESEPIVHDYARPTVIGDISKAPEIPEEEIERTTIDLSVSDLDDDDDDSFIKDVKEEKESRPKEKFFEGNPDLKEGTKKENKKSAIHLAETIVDGYVMAHEVSKSFLVMSDEKLMKQAVKGKIDMDAINSEIQLGKKVYQMRKLIYDYNNNINDVLVVSDEFKEEVTPLLAEELEANNMGMTRMQRLGMIVVKDLQPKIVSIAQLNGTMKSLLMTQTEILRQNKDRIKQQEESNKDDIIIEDNYEEPEEK